MWNPATVDSYSVITIANNNINYVKFALNCAQSVILFNPIKVYIISNLNFNIPAYVQHKVFKLAAKPGHAELGIEAKLYMNDYLQTEHTLFIDADCLCFGSLAPAFKACENMDVSAVGRTIPLEDYWGAKAGFARKEFGTDKTILFNGALYYLRKSPLTKIIFDKAREIAVRYDDYGFDRLKNNWKNEEELIAIGMAANNQSPIPDNGTFMTDLVTDQRPAVLNVLEAKVRLRNATPGHIKHRRWYPECYSPLIVHFGGGNIASYPYLSQSILLKLQRGHIPARLSALIVTMAVHFPYKTYHRMRAMLKSNRMMSIAAL